MVRVITQETFNEVVKENIDEFSMTPEEAVKEAIDQFEAQGVDLSHVVKDISVVAGESGDQNPIIKIIAGIEELLKTKTASPELAEQFINLSEECNKSLAHKILAAKNGAYSVILSALEDHATNVDIVSPAFNALISLMSGQPDLLDERGIKLMMYYLDHQSSSDLHQLVLKWAKQCCLKHEKNRQDIFKHNILDHLKKFLDDNTSPILARDACNLIRSLVMDDDIRVAFGNAHEHARIIAQEVLGILVNLLKKYKENAEMASDLLLTLTSLVVRKEFCEKVEECGGIMIIIDIITTYLDNEKLVRLSLSLLKALAGSDDVKDRTMKAGVAPLITHTMNKHRASPALTAAGCSCIAALSLRSPSNSRILCDEGAPEAIVQGMKAHPVDEKVQKMGSSAMRNIVCRAQDLAKEFLELGAEEVLNSILAKCNDKVEYEVKLALRDLGCKVQLTEQWTGKGGAMN